MLSIQPLVHADERGRLIKLLRQGAFHELGLPEVFAELVVSESAARVVRGLQ
jgi:dTDP-4-dehydrorhamnose 3,5-epimerase-like enzyme